MNAVPIMAQPLMVVTAVFIVMAGFARTQQQNITSSTTKPAYPTKFDFLNIDTILLNKRLLKSFYRCLIDTGPCTQEGNALKRVIPDALKSQCRKCTIPQKRNGHRAINFLMKNKPDFWAGINKKYDPANTLFKKMLADPQYLKDL